MLVTAASRLAATGKVDRNFSEAPHLGEIFTTEDGLWYKVSGDIVLFAFWVKRPRVFGGQRYTCRRITGRFRCLSNNILT